MDVYSDECSSNQWRGTKIKKIIVDNTLNFVHSLLIHPIFITLTIMTQPPEQNSRKATGGVLNIFANLTGKHLCWSLFFTKLQAFRHAILLKGDSYTGVFLWDLKNS